jgi:uncharacterized membrane protein (DUF485 family)
MDKPTALAGIRENPIFGQLVRCRRSFVIRLTLATLLPYYAFILVAGFAPHLLGEKIFPESMVTIGWVTGLLLIVGTWLLTGLYVRRANGECDELTAQILAGAEQ